MARAAALRGGNLKREAEGIQRKIAGIMAAIEDGMYTPVLKERMKALEKRMAEIDGLLADADTPPVVRLHPNMAEIYRLKVGELEVALNDDNIKAEAGEVLRSFIDRVVLTRVADAPDGIEAQLYGDQAAILQLSNGGDKQKLPAKGVAGSLLSVVAGERNQRYLQSLRSMIPVFNRPVMALSP